MIYLKAGEQYVLVLEPSNIEKLKNGEPIKTPDGSVLIAYCPDIDWLSEEVQKLVGKDNRMDVAAFDALLREGLDRPTVYDDDQRMKRLR